MQGDVSQEEDIIRVVNAVIQKFGNLDILVNSAGIQTEGVSHDVPTNQFDQELSLSICEALICVRNRARSHRNPDQRKLDS